MDREGDEQQTQKRHQMGSPRASDGVGLHGELAQSDEQGSKDNDQRSLQADLGRPCEPRFDLKELLIELEQERLGSSIIERAFYPAPLTIPARDAEWRAWEQLRFASLLPSAPFDEELAASGWYSAVYRHHSDKGLAEIEAKEKPPSSELAAFKRLEELGVLTESDFYSPAKAKNQFYTNRLANQLHSHSTNERTRTRSPKGNQAGSGKAATEVEKYRRRRHKEG